MIGLVFCVHALVSEELLLLLLLLPPLLFTLMVPPSPEPFGEDLFLA